MKKVILFGTGGLSKNTLLQIDKTQYEVIEFWDNDNKKWGTEFEGVKVTKPHKDCGDVDKIIVASSFYQEIFEQLTKELEISSDKIENYLWFDKVELLQYYDTHPEQVNDEIQEILKYLRVHNLEVFNYEFNKKYTDIEVDIQYDLDAKLFYVYHKGKKMYMKKSLDSERKVREYYISLLMEQDNQSPHCYGKYIQNEKYDVLIDAGCAEGNFVLDNMERAEKIFIIENNEEWLEALNYTLEPYGEKITIINKYLSDCDDDKNISLDGMAAQYHISMEKKYLIKLDIEGAEEKAIIGGEEAIEMIDDITIIACTYHHKNAGKILQALLEQKGMDTEFSQGYMFFPAEYERKTITDISMEKRKPDLRRGLLIGNKREWGKDKILDLYAEDFRLNYCSYNMMGRMLEKRYIKERIELAKIKNVYIYGGGYLGIQLYYAIKDLTNVESIADKSGGICIEDRSIPVVTFEQMKNSYQGQKIIITPIRYYSTIKRELMQFADERDILYLGEFLEGEL